MTEYKTVGAAEALLASSTKNMWELADAVLGDVPAESHGGDRKSNHPRGGFDIESQLHDIAERLGDLGVTAPNGEPYTTITLTHYRETAMAWPADERHAEAAYRTHQEAGGRESPGRVALAGLCAVARGDTVRCPVDFDKTSWASACARIRDRLNGRRLRYAVTANDVRVALARRPNVPPARRFGIMDLLSHLDDARRYLIAFRIDFAELPDLGPEDLAAVVRSIDSLVDEAVALREAASASLTDEALEGLLAEEGQS